ncbi:uncharacterized protein LACBIDRAFT_335043 [Laccaria bicolor S238N-H82]|uniref:Predicted protein n=1 Tax=Laccaria bicolor (strain S238N-H82 / ATCC MYA-4686) TaxID=486041 RepID=B0E164_LACBS|nr:uncharacterized protein LACBIDRAFT_335043 [Laccaria bicolor S238N-H82]EDQ99372.1 predicted protein [Laccaria bicolor S238N-H82]|eukprot:XP_001889923.1 predicted protein [Laccaria bicolor S238N-H82]
MEALLKSNPVELLHQIQSVGYIQVILIFPYLTTAHILGLQVTTWDLEKKKWTIVTVLFVINYHAIPNLLKIVILVVIAFTAEILAMLVIDFLYLRHIIMGIEPLPGVHMCISYPTNWYFVSWIPIFGYELLILILGIRAGILFFKEARMLPSNFGKQSLRSILLRDSILYPIMRLQCLGLVKVDEVYHTGRSCLGPIILESFRQSSHSQPSGSILSSFPGRVQPKWTAANSHF